MPITRRQLLTAAATTPFLSGASRRAEGWKISSFRLDITCPIGHPLLGRRQGTARTIVGPLHAHGTVILGAGKPIVITAVDWCELRNDAYDSWRQMIATATSTTPERVILSCVHQHDAPLADLSAQRLLDTVGMQGEMFDPSFFKTTGERIASAARESLSDATTLTHIELSQARVQRIASNRRIQAADGKVSFDRGSNGARTAAYRDAPEGLIDPWLKTITLCNGKRRLVSLSCYATHPMSYYGQGGVNADFVGIARNLRRAEDPGVNHIYLSGCSGDVTGGKYNDGSTANRAILADRLLRAMRESSAQARRHRISQVIFRNTPLELPYRSSPTYTTEAMTRVLQNTNASRKERVLAAMGLSTRQHLARGKKIDVPCLDFGHAQLVLLPGEAFVGYQLMAQRLRPNSFVMSVGYGQCWPGYLPTDSAFKDGFDGFWLWVDPGSEARIRAALRKVLAPPGTG